MNPIDEDDIPKNPDGSPMFGFYKGMPVLLAIPESMTEGRIYDVVAGTLPTTRHVQELMAQMWEDSNAEFYYYHGVSGEPSIDGPMLAAKNIGMIEMAHRERRYYKHSTPGAGFVHILDPASQPPGLDKHPEAVAWEKSLIEKGPEYWRVTLKLSPRKQHEFDTISKVQLEEVLRKRAEQARYDYDVFLSYASANIEQAEGLHAKLKAAGLRVFMAKKSLEGGDDFAEEIRKALIGSKQILLLVSPTSIASEWVITEWGAAWVLGKKIRPILYQCPPSMLSDRLRKLHCTDLHDVDHMIASLSTAPDQTEKQG